LFVDDGLKYCLKEITRDGNCPPNDGPVECSAEFIYALGSTSRAGDCECQELPENKRSCSCCVNCNIEANLLSDTLHIHQIDGTPDRCSN